MVWVGETNKYFTCIMAPVEPAAGHQRVAFADVNSLTQSKEDLLPNTPSDLSFGFVTVPLTVDPGQATDLSFECYIGPKSKVAFQEVPA